MQSNDPVIRKCGCGPVAAMDTLWYLEHRGQTDRQMPLDKYNIELSRLSSDTVRQCLAEKQVPDEQQARILHTLQQVDMARFAPGDASTRKQEIYDEALQMIVMI